MKASDYLTLFQAMLLFGGFVLAVSRLRLLGKQIELMTRQIEQQLDWWRRQATFDYLGRYRTELRDTNLKLQKKLAIMHQDGREIDHATMVRSLETDETRLQLFELIYYYEHLAIGINAGYFHEGLAKESLANVVVSSVQGIEALY